MTTASTTKIDATLLDSDVDEAKHLVFRLADELYATPLSSIREITKMQHVKPVPFMAPCFRGILNLRGQIISVVDLRLKFDMPCPEPNSGLLIVVDTDNGPIATIVDDVVSVNDFDQDSIETNLALKTKVPVEFFTGVGHLGERLVNIIEIGKTLSNEDFAIVRRMKDQAVGL